MRITTKGIADKRYIQTKEAIRTWRLAASAFIALAILVAAISFLRTPKTAQKPVQQTPRVIHEWTQGELDQLNCEINPASCPKASPKPRKWTFTNYAGKEHYSVVIDGLKARFTNWEAVAELVARESGFNPVAQNPKSTAYGLGQFLDMHGVRTKCGADIDCQLDALKGYIAKRYGTATKALAFWEAHSWY